MELLNLKVYAIIIHNLGRGQVMTINLLTYFIIYSLMGWAMESFFRTIAEKKFINTGFLYGPFCPIYGIGAIIMFLFLHNYKDNMILVFILGFIVLSVWEYVVGWLLEKIFHTKYWDYSENKFNIQGRVCLMNSLFWGVLGVVFIKFIHPFVTELLAKVPANILTIMMLALGIYLLIDAIVTIVKVKKIDIRIIKLAELNETIKTKLNELKELTDNSKSPKFESLQLKVEELKLQQTKLKKMLLRQTIRLKKAFPTMKSERITEFLSQKIEEIKNNK